MVARRFRPALARWLLAVLLLSTVSTAEAADPLALPSPLRAADVATWARAHRAEIQASRAGAAAAAERPEVVSRLDDPVVSLSVDHLPFMLHGVDASMTVEQAFPLSRVLSHRRRAAEAAFRQARARTDRVALDVELEALAAFYMVWERREMDRILDAQVILAEQIVAAAEARYATGSGVQADVLRMEVEVSRLRATRAALAAEVRGAEAMLAASLGLPVATPIPPLSVEEDTDEPAPPVALLDAAKARPELAAGRAEISEAEAEVEVMESMYSPMGMVRGGPAYTMTDGPGVMVMVGISIPLWRDSLAAGVREAEAMRAMARRDLDAMQLMIEGEVSAAREQVVAAAARLAVIRDELVPRAEQAVEPTLGAYASGQLPLVSALEALQTLWSAEAERVMALSALGIARARLARAVGGKEAP